jgi:outer membrane protein assembly factor BamB
MGLTPHARIEPRLGVIIAPWLVGPLALLGMLFPAIFGGLVEGMRRWMVWISVVGLIATIPSAREFCLWWFNVDPGVWWARESLLWLTVASLSFVGAWWAWRRHVGRVAAPETSVKALARPGRGEVITLVLLSLLGFIPFLIWPPQSLGQFTILMKTLGVIQVGLLAATLHSVLLALVRSPQSHAPRLPGEGVALLAMLMTTFLIMPAPQAGAGIQPLASLPEQKPGVPVFKRVAWRMNLPEPAWIASSPTLMGDRVYFGAVHGAAFRSGAVYCLDAKTGDKIWSFNNGGNMKDVFCSPTIADGFVYIGEGFHQHLACRLYCLDAETGEKKWEFETDSHTESTPSVVGDKVYFGAGDDGLYCLDARTGKEVWHLVGLHIDSNPLVVDGRVYAGSGKGDAFQEYALVCLDAQTGKEVWPRLPLDLPSWGGPALAGNLLLVGVGNGNFMESEANPAGAVLGIDIRTGRRIWRTDLKDGVHVKLATDGKRVWVGSRDNTVACLKVSDGEKLWSKDLASPIVASPALVPGLLGARATIGLGHPHSGKANPPVSLIVATSAGGVACLNPDDGEIAWTFNVAQDADTSDVQMFSSPCVEVTLGPEGERRRIFFGCGLNTFNKGTLYCLEDERN